MDFNFFMPVKVISGKGVLLKNSGELRNLGKRCLVITTKSAAEKSGAMRDIISCFEKEGVYYEVYNDIEQNPHIDKCLEAAVKANGFTADFILGVGGGSALDAAKAAAIYAANPHLDADGIYSYDFRNPPLPLVLIGTTAGTGSEVSGVSVLSHHKTLRKKSISGSFCYAKLAFADPAYTYSMPYGVTVSTALDALSHGIEAWFSPKLSSPVKELDKEGLRLVWDALKALNASKITPDEDGRDRLFYGSLFTGMALNACGTAFPHTLGYVLTEDFAVPHGRACCAFLPYHIERGAYYEKERAAELFRLLNSDIEEINGLIKALADIKNIEMSIDALKGYISRWESVGNFLNSPGSYTQKDAGELLKKLFVK